MDSGKVYTVEGKQIAVFRLEDGVYAVENMCPQCLKDMGKSPVVVEEAVTCPTHGWALDIVKGECPVAPEYPFTTYPACVKNGRILIEI
jgi:nitrite reductase/ring-hydroxylating ferredoxin subunit